MIVAQSIFYDGLLVVLLVGRRDQFEPLPERVAQRLRQGVDVSQDDVKREGELVHVGTDIREFSRSFENGHLYVEDGVLRKGTAASLDHSYANIDLKKKIIKNVQILTREFGLSRTTKMTKTLAPRADLTAAITRSLPSRNRPRPSETMTSNWAMSVEEVKGCVVC